MRDRDKLSKRLQAEAERLEARRPRPAEAERPPKSDANGFAAVVHMTTGIRLYFLFGTWLVMCVAGAIIGGVIIERGYLVVGIAFAALLGTIIPVVLVVALFRLPAYRGWQTRQPFPVDGNFDLLAGDRAPDAEWRKCQVEVALANDRPQDVATVQVALRALCARANRKTYVTRWGKIASWSVEELSAQGDANVRVAWVIYRFVSTELRALANAGVAIEGVTIHMAANSRTVAAESSDAYYD